MTMVFGGLDLPVIEMLFIVSVLLLAGLFVMILGIFYMLKEFRELKEILKKEEDNITKFEKDISSLETFSGNQNKDANVKAYIREYLSKGYTWEVLKPHMISQGIDEKKLEEIYKSLK